MKSNPPWYKDGLKFECQGSGKCCVSHGEYGYVYLDLNDRKRMAKHLGLTLKEFTGSYCSSTEGYYHLKIAPDETNCMFLENKQCEIYEARPTQCRTWPFWPEVLNPKTWKSDVANFCPGVGKGRLYSPTEIESISLEQTLSEDKMEREPLPKSPPSKK